MHALATLLAGLPSGINSAQSAQSAADPGGFAAIRQSPAWRRHAERLDALFDALAARHLVPFRRWADASAAPVRRGRTLFYPFGGPDALFPTLLHPDADAYVLCGLEPCGLPRWPHALAADPAAALDGLAAGLRHFAAHAYFVTSDLRAALLAAPLPGVAPLLLALLARAGHTIRSVQSVTLAAHDAADETAARGVDIAFGRRARPQRLLYLQQDLRDDRLDANHPLLRHLHAADRLVVFGKSASYLLHEANFSRLRTLILERADALVQDPSGLPYRSFAEHGWQVHLHGRYAGAPRSFPQYEQPDLRAAFHGSAAAPLDFGIGYHQDPPRASLLVAMPPCAS